MYSWFRSLTAVSNFKNIFSSHLFTDFRHTNVYLFAQASSFVPSMKTVSCSAVLFTDTSTIGSGVIVSFTVLLVPFGPIIVMLLVWLPSAVTLTNTSKERIYYSINLDVYKSSKGLSVEVLDEDGVLCFATTPEMDMKKYYLPVAIAIVSYAHLIIDDAIVSTGFDNFVYCDTDSVHTIGDLNPDIVDNFILGKFKLEGIELKSKYIRQKTYCYCELGENNEMEYTITCAGMNDATKQYLIDTEGDNVFNVFDKGLTIEGYKLLPMQVPGGTVLVPSTFTLKE